MFKNVFKKQKSTSYSQDIRIFVVNIYIDLYKKCTIIPLKQKIDSVLRSYSFPIYDIKSSNYDNVAISVIDVIDEIMKEPFTSDDGEEVANKLYNNRSQKDFAKQHILIEVVFDRLKEEYYIRNIPRIKNSKDYGQIIKNTLTEHYSTKYICHSEQEIQEAIEKAYEEGLAYLEAIGEPLKDPSDNKNTNKSSKSDKSSNSNRINTNKEFTTDNNTDKDIINEVPLYKNTWLVLKNDDNDGFSRLLSDIKNKSKTTYTNALKASREDKIMITGLYDDYYVISGFNIPSGDKTEEVKSLLDKLSNYSSEIAYYSSFRTVDLFGFAYMKDKKLLRLYSYCESILANIGDKLPIEEKLNINLTDNDDNLFKEGYDLLDEDILTNISNGLSLSLEDLIGRQADETYTFDIDDLY